MDPRVKATMATVPAIDFETLFAFNRHALESFADLTGRTIERSAALNAVWGKLLQKRMEQNVALPQKLADCRTPDDYFRICAEWAQVAVTQYQEGFDSMARIGQDIQREAADVVSDTLNGASHGLSRAA